MSVQGLWQPYQPQTAGNLPGASGPALPMHALAPAPADGSSQAGASLADAGSDSSAGVIMPASIASQAAAPAAAAAPAVAVPYSGALLPQVGKFWLSPYRGCQHLVVLQACRQAWERAAHSRDWMCPLPHSEMCDACERRRGRLTRVMACRTIRGQIWAIPSLLLRLLALVLLSS